MYDVGCTMYAIFFNYKIRFMDSEEMKRRTKQFAINVGILTQSVPNLKLTGHIVIK